MSKYIIIDDGYTATLAERQYDGSYKTINLSEKGALVRLLEEIAKDGSVSEAEANTELTLVERIERLREAGYGFSSDVLDEPENSGKHRDAWFDDGDNVYDTFWSFCAGATLEETVEAAEEHNNGRI